MRGAGGGVIGRIKLPVGWRLRRPERPEFVVISRDVAPRSERYYPNWASGLNVMLIERKEHNGVVERVNIPRESVAEVEWVQLERTWECVTLT